MLSAWRLLLLILLPPCLAQAELTVDVNKGIEGAMPIAIAPFGQTLSGENMASIISADLARSGRFDVLPEGQMPEQATAPDQVHFPVWQAAGRDHLAIGQVQQVGAGQYEADFFLFDAIRGSQVTGGKIPFAATDYRRTAHRIADVIYKQLTGEAGAFATRLAFVSQSGSGNNREYRLLVGDSDGQNGQAIFSSPEPIMSPAWSPDAKQIAYVSFENKQPAVYVQSLADGSRRKISQLPGINGAPAWSPDGSKVALTLSKDGNPEIYVLDMSARTLRRITQDMAIDTEPSFSRDGGTLLFTSDRGGKPQLYTVPAEGGAPERLTFDGDYNARGIYSPDGRSIAMVHGSSGDYRIALMDLRTKSVKVLTQGPLDESPGFAPNGRMVLYATRTGGGANLAAVSIDGRARQTLRSGGAQVREPAWAPQ